MRDIADISAPGFLASATSVASSAELVVHEVAKSFGAFRAVDGVSFSISRHEVKSVIGPNGAGKSTLFSCLAGTLRPTSGTVRFNSEDITFLPPQRRVKKGLVKSFQTTAIFPQLTVRDNIVVAALGASLWSVKDLLVTPRSKPEILGLAETTLGEVRLLSRHDAIASNLSHGEQRKLEIGIALACGARLLLLDEPTAGMGIDDIQEFIELVDRLRRRCGILLVEHNMNIVLGLSDRVVVMAQGKVICEGTPQDVRSDPVVRSAYLGRRH